MPTIAVEHALSQPAEKVGGLLLNAPEDQWFDRKSARAAPRNLADALIGMANAEGGILAVGLYQGRVEGTDANPQHRNAQMQASLDFSDPPVHASPRLVPCRNERGELDNLLIFDLEPSDIVHANRKDEVFLRVGDENRRLTFRQRQELLYDKGQASYEVRRLEEASFARLDMPLLKNYASAVGHPDPMRLIEAKGLARDARLTVAGALLFAVHPQEFLPESFLRVLRYRGQIRGTGARQQLLSDHICEGPLPRQLQMAQRAIREMQPVRRALLGTGRFGDVALVPEDAWLEGMVNAVIHRSYSMAGDHIRVEIFDDRLEIASPGRFPGLVDLSDPLHATRFARNPRIARVCADLRFGQELGEGIRRIFEEMREAGLNDPVYRQTSGAVHLTLSGEPRDRELQARLPEEARVITGALREAGRLSTGELTEILGVSRPVATRHLRTLRDAGLIEWNGKSTKDPRAYWTLRLS
jgi:ATP-dependent DNA helicase RecG